MDDHSALGEQRHARAQLAGILAIAGDAIITMDERHRITLFNSGAERIFGYGAAEVMGRPLDILLPARFGAAHAGHVQRFESSGIAARQMGERREIFGRRKSGDEFPAEASIAKLTLGTVTTFTVVLRDVSQRKAAEEALRVSAERTRVAVEVGRVGLFEHEHETGRWYWSPLYRDMFGWDAEADLSQAAYLAAIHPDDRDRVDAAVSATFAPDGRGVFELEHRIVRSDGVTRWLSVNSRTEFSGEGAGRRPRRTIGAVRDITEQKTLELSLEARVAARTAELSAVLDAVPDAIVTADEMRRLRTSNATVASLFGYGRDEIVGMTESNLYATPSDYHAVERAWPDWERDAARKPILVGCARKDGSVFSAIVIGSTVHDRHGDSVSRITLIRDMTDELTRQNMFVQAQRMEALGQLTGGVAHDSNNLLTVISGNLEMVEEELERHPAMTYVREAQEAARMGARLNQRLLTFARRRTLEPQVVNLNDQVIAMSELLRRTIGETIELSTILAHDLGATLVDPSEVENAVLNLAINARDAMVDGGNLRIETRNVRFDAEQASAGKGLVPGDYVRLSVSDTGCGMPPEIVARVFEPFFTTKAPGKGSGLGLATIFGFVTQSSGHVSVHSEVGQGSTIHIYLPRLHADGKPHDGRAGSPSLPRARGERILVVEDNAQVRTLTVERLRRLGYHVAEADSGPGALALLAAGQTVDLVFSDVVMPGGLSGFDLARAILDRSPDQRVLLTSGFAEDMTPGHDILLGPHAILRKPYSTAELARAVRRSFDKSDHRDT